MSGIRAEWLVQGCLRLGDLPETDRVSLQVRSEIEGMYPGAQFAVRGWPQQGFRETLWWYEKEFTPGSSASYFLKVDPWRGPALYAGITVEKAFEDVDVAERLASKRNIPTDWYLLNDHWDWHRLLASLPASGGALQTAAGSLGRELYCWLEFGEDQHESRYFVIKQDALYRRGGFKPIGWDEVLDFASKSRPQAWGKFCVVRAFNLDECSPELDIGKLLEVFRILKSARDSWSGPSPLKTD